MTYANLRNLRAAHHLPLAQASLMNAAVRKSAVDVFAVQSRMSLPGRFGSALEKLPTDMHELLRVIQNLVVYDVVAPDFYDYRIPQARADEIHIRSVEALLGRIFELDNRMLSASRPVEKRLVGRCHHFMMLLVSVLRARGVPARARCGFGAYFNPPSFEDHWVCEYWNARESRWMLVDAQFDDVWRKKLRIDHDVLDVPRDRFVVAADAWQRCRSGAADAESFGISFEKMHGLWYIAGNLVRDAAALNDMESLPWDVWGAQPKPRARLDEEQLAFFDRVADLTIDPDRTLLELRHLYATNDGLKVPNQVFNALRQRQEDFV